MSGRARLVKWFGVFNLVFAVGWCAAWFLTAMRVWAGHHLSLGGALFVSVIWMPVGVANLLVVNWSMREDLKELAKIRVELDTEVAHFRAAAGHFMATYGGLIDAYPPQPPSMH
jgi:hypothetical protein